MQTNFASMHTKPCCLKRAVALVCFWQWVGVYAKCLASSLCAWKTMKQTVGTQSVLANLSLKQQLKYNNLVYRAKIIATASVEEYDNALHFDCKPPKTLQLMRFQCAKKNRSSYSWLREHEHVDPIIQQCRKKLNVLSCSLKMQRTSYHLCRIVSFAQWPLHCTGTWVLVFSVWVAHNFSPILAGERLEALESFLISSRKAPFFCAAPPVPEELPELECPGQL